MSHLETARVPFFTMPCDLIPSRDRIRERFKAHEKPVDKRNMFARSAGSRLAAGLRRSNRSRSGSRWSQCETCGRIDWSAVRVLFVILGLLAVAGALTL